MDITTTEAVEHLQAVGFNESEALAYATLIQKGPMTGYQLAKTSGIARPNVYAVIERLEKRGTLARIGLGDGVKYAALPAAEMLAAISSNVSSHLASAEAALGKLNEDPGPAYVWNVEGYDAVLAQAERIVSAAKTQLLIGLWSNESAHLADALRVAQERGVEVVTLCVQGCAHECGSCRGDVYRYAVSASPSSRWLLLVADERDVLMGEITTMNGEARAAHTALPMIAALTGQYIRNTIAAAEIVRSLGPKLPRILDKEAARAVDGDVLAVEAGGSWLKQLVATMRRARG